MSEELYERAQERALRSRHVPPEERPFVARYFAEREATPLCEHDVPVRDLPLDCIESAATPAVLYDKLDDWGHDAIVIPHGTSWGFYSPPGSSWDKQLNAAQHDPQRGDVRGRLRGRAVGHRLSHRATQPSTVPAATSAAKWLPVAMTSHPTPAGYARHAARPMPREPPASPNPVTVANAA